ncbi:MAG: OmpW family protein [Pseudomonadota bacterium]
MRKLILAAALATTALAPISAAAEAGDFLIRGRIIGVLPNDDASGIMPAFPGGSVEVDNAFVPEVDFTYFFTNNIAAELILATSPHDINGTGDIGGLGQVGEVWVLPPTLTVQYHFNPSGPIRPYVGAGINYTIFYGEDTTSSLNDAIGQTSLDVDPSLGWAVQAGVDYDITEKWFANVDVKYINIETEAILRTGVAANKVDLDINPLVVGIGVGRRF